MPELPPGLFQIDTALSIEYFLVYKCLSLVIDNMANNPKNEYAIKLIIRLVVFAILSLYFIYYLSGQFVPKINENSWELNFLKIFFSLTLLVLLFINCLDGKRIIIRYDVLPIFLFFITALLFFILRFGFGEQHGELASMFFNLFLFLPILFIPEASASFIPVILRAFAWTILFQGVVSIILLTQGVTLWVERSIVGGLGNPSSFGLAVCISYLIFNFSWYRPSTKIIVKALLIIMCLLTNSLFSIGSLLFVVAVTIKRRSVVYLMPLVALLLFLSLLGVDFSNYPLLNYIDLSFIWNKLGSLFSFLGIGSHGVTSLSVSWRSFVYQYVFNHISIYSFFLGGMDDQVYWFADSQYLTYFASFGFICFLIFLFSNIYFLIKLYWFHHFSKEVMAFFLLVALGIFSFMFVFNRILDYYPMAMVYFCLIRMASGDTFLRGGKHSFSLN